MPNKRQPDPTGMERCVDCGILTEPEFCYECGDALCTPCFEKTDGLCEECFVALEDDDE